MQYAYLTPSTVITLPTGVVQMYRLPTMMPGPFHLYARQVGVFVPPPERPALGAPVGPVLGTPVMSMIRSGAGGITIGGGLSEAPPFPPLGGGGGAGGGGFGTVANLKMDLYHGDLLVVSGVNNLPLQQNISDGDDTWRVQLQVEEGAPEGTYSFNVTLNPYPSDFPQLTRRVPLAFLQQGFDNNWKGRNYISLAFVDGELLITFDPEVASYYGLSNVQYLVASMPLVSFPNIQVSDISLSVSSSDGPYEGWPAPLPYIWLSVKFTGVNGQPMTASILGFDLSANEFTVNVKLFLIPVGFDVTSSCVGYVSQVATDLISQLDGNGEVKKQIREALDGYLKDAQTFLDSHAFVVGTAITPWLLGAAFAVVNVRYDPTNSQPVPADGPQGDLVIDYIAQRPAPSALTSGISLGGFGAPRPLALDPGPVAGGVLGTAYSQAFTAMGGQPPYTWTITGSLPPGLTASGAVLSGTPTAVGAYALIVAAADSAGATAAQGFTITINPQGLAIGTDSALPDAILTLPYALQFAVQDAAIQTYTWSVDSLPAGLMLLPQGVIQGTPSGVSGHTSFVLHVIGSDGPSAWKAFSLKLQDPELFPVIYAPRGDADTYWKPNVAAGNALPGVPHPLGPATTQGNLHKVKHIVLVMMENRSFDHMLGYLSREGGRSDIEGLKWESPTHSTQFNYYMGQYYYPYVLTDTQVIKSEPVGPDHSHESVKGQMCDGMMHFVADYAERKVGNDPAQLQVVMGYYTGVQLPVYDMLAREYGVCDHWFSSHPGPTWPNRFVAMTGDLNRDSYGEPEVNTPLYSDFTPSEALTLFDHLSARGVTWKYFQQRESMMRAFTKYSFDMVNVVEYSDAVQGFLATVKNGQLPSFTWIDPLFGDLPAGVGSPQDNDDAPPSDLKFGQQFIQEVYSTLFSSVNPNWADTMMIVVYDEHGGFYDHVDPPDNATPLLGQNSGKLGPRVPAFVISSYTPAGLALKDTYDHGSIAATVLRRFCSPHPPEMGPRVAAARDLRDALPLDLPRPLVPSRGTLVTDVSGVVAPEMLRRTALRRFRLPTKSDDFGSALGGIALTLGSTPGSS